MTKGENVSEVAGVVVPTAGRKRATVEAMNFDSILQGLEFHLGRR